jgi:SAM-dependent methyltransferase
MTDDTFDWEAYWAGDRDGGPMDATPLSADDVSHLTTFFERVGTPDSVAAVGCGDGTFAAALASEFPAVTVRGYDVSQTAVETARERHGDGSNLAFAVAEVPAFDVDRRFDLVWCVHTLDYVRDVERALRALYDRVAPGGNLVVRYPSPEVCETYGENVERGTPLYDRFELVCEGVNEITRERIDDLLGGQVRDFWALVDASEGVHGALSWDPTVVVSKPPADAQR